MSEIERLATAVVAAWHPGVVERIIAENGRLILPPKLYDEATSAARAVLIAMRHPSDGALEAAAIMQEDGYFLTKMRLLIDHILSVS